MLPLPGMFSGSEGSSGQLTNAPCSSEDLSQALTQECGDDDDLEDVPMEDWPTQVLAEFIQRKRPKVGHDCVAMLQASLAIPPDENVTESEVQEKAELVKVKIREADEKFGKKVQSALRLRERFLECWYNRDWDKFKGLLSDFSKISMCRQLLVEIHWLVIEELRVPALGVASRGCQDVGVLEEGAQEEFGCDGWPARVGGRW